MWLLWQLIVFLSVLVYASAGSVQFEDTQVIAEEGKEFNIRVRHTGDITQIINVVVSVDNINQDFIGNSQLASFSPGGPSISNVTFTVNDDDQPEIEETYIFSLSVLESAADVVAPNMATVIIQANDDAYGVFRIIDTSPLRVQEDSVSTNVLNVNIGREFGTFGEVTVTYRVESASPDANVGQDITPAIGSVTFSSQEVRDTIQLQIRADDIPENDEHFILLLTSATQGARVINDNFTIIITANDAPVRFQQSEFRFDEGPITRTVSLTINRGLDLDGVTPIGSVDGITTLNYMILPNTALLGLDFRGMQGQSSGQLVFPAGERTVSLNIQIIDDSDPELEENFQVLLSSPVGDVILLEPSRADVIISANDNPSGVLSLRSPDLISPPTVQINEDADSDAIFTVLRSARSFGSVSVKWEVVRNDSMVGPVTDDLNPATGTVTFAQGETEKAIIINIVNDTLSEPAERFVVHLLPQTATGSAKVDGIIHGVLILEDSDNIYGAVQFADDSRQILVIDAEPRMLQLVLQRVGANIGDIYINLTVAYTPSGGGSADVLEKTDISTIIAAGQFELVEHIHIEDAAFIQVGGVFTAVLSGVAMVTEPPIGAFNTPRLGERKRAEVQVTPAEANGEIGFDSISTLTVDEYQDRAAEVVLKLSREGTSGDATISWTVQGTGTNAGHVTSSDIAEMNGTIIMRSGMSETSIVIRILQDDIPELDEELTVTLTKVEPALTQRLRQGAKQRKIIISENDNPGGVFQFAIDEQLSYEISEGGTPVQFTVVREDGDLISKAIQYMVINGEADFLGYTNILTFPPGVRSKTFSIAAKSDGVPELEETFILRLQSYGTDLAVFGARSSVEVKVTKNDAPHGVLQFVEQTIYLNESKNEVRETATIGVQRVGGLFGGIKVSWALAPSNEEDLRPASGFLTFSSDQDIAYISLESVPDEITELAETFTLVLSDPEGGATVGEQSSSIVVINANDYPLYFVEASVEVEEPSETVVLIKRDGPTTSQVTVKYRTVDGSASGESNDYMAVISGQLIFAVGEVEKSVTVRIYDDQTPEGRETFYLEIYEILGDYVISGPSRFNISILDNDDAYGVFRFDAPFTESVEEGGTASFGISRDRGTFGAVTIFYKLYFTSTNEEEQNGGDFLKAQGLSVTFQIGEKTKYIQLTPRMDNKPEPDKTFTILLSRLEVVEGRTDVSLASIQQGTSALLTILASDDPNGRFGFPILSKAVSIAEDFYPGNAASTQASLVVQRRMGIYGTVEVLWEVYSDRVAGALPQVYDLLFLSNIPSNFVLVPSKRRKGTGTNVVSFTGLEPSSSIISVPSMYQPPSNVSETGLTLTAWVIPFANTDGYILAKTNSDGSRHFYTLRLTTSSLTTVLTLGLSSTGVNGNVELSVAYPQNIEDTLPHHIVVTVEASTIMFYIDNNFIANRSLNAAQTIIDSQGQLTVGSIYPGTLGRFTGYMQDVRVYTRKLSSDEITELYMMPSKDDVSPISGYITYPAGLREGSININALQDMEEESDEIFTVKLINSKGGAAISTTDYMSTLTVLKSDNANGLFFFSQQCVPNNPLTENVEITCTIGRQRGDDGQVIVTWAVYQLIGSQAVMATEDFADFTGQVVFNAGERTKTFSVLLKDDNIPESQEMYEVRLVSTDTEDGVSGSTNSSGASLDITQSASVITVKENDFPYGVLQFSADTTPPLPDAPFIPMATEQPTVRVAEEAGVVRLLVVRAQGYQGEITVEWRTTDGTAKSSGKVLPDYAADVGRLTFRNGERYKYINVNIIDNDKPEDEKTFVVSLLNPSGGAEIRVGSVVTVVIEHSDGAFGVFQFQDSSRGIQAEESGDSGFNIVSLEIQRVGGSIGQSEVTWDVQGDNNNDIVNKQGTVIFLHDQLLSNLDLKIRGDTAPELDELFFVQITNVSRGSLGISQYLRAEVTILANDDPYGKFVIPETQRPRTVEEGNTVVTMTIQRLGGTYGSVQVNYTTLTPTESYPYIPTTIPRANLEDYTMTSGSVTFTSGQGVGTFNVNILDDLEPEESEAVYVRLTGIRLLEAAQIRPVDNSPSFGSETDSYGQIIINFNDNANGEIVLSPSSPTVQENTTEPLLYATRFGGAFGEVSVSFTVTDGTAINGLDYIVDSNLVTLPRGQKSVPLPIRLINDNVPEVSETFTVKLDQVSGGGTLGTVTSVMVVIDKSDDPNGAFEFSVDGVSVEEPETGSLSVNITVIRKGGSLGVMTLEWTAMLNGVMASEDITPTSGSVFFVSNEVTRQILVTVLPDTIPEGTEDVKIELTSVSSGGRIGPMSVFTLSIQSNDNPHGVVQFSDPVYVLDERGTNSVQNLRLIRSGGSFGQLKVYYSTDSATLISSDVNSLGTSVLTYFLEPKFGTRGLPGSFYNISGLVGEPVILCGTECLKQIPCHAFEILTNNNVISCTLYNTPFSSSLINTNNVRYYEKDSVKAGELTGTQATPGEDYSVVTNGYILIDEDVMAGQIPISILADTVPELDEKFVVFLTRVDVTGEPPSFANSPYIGEVRNTTVTISSNDDAYGAFTIYSDSPIATEAGHVIQVDEQQNLAVDLIVERQGGSIGEVSVLWFVDTQASTAVYGVDYRADGATLNFVPGETRKLITVTILDDTVPELSKTVIVKLSNPRGGATLVNGSATIVISENDYIAGVVSLSTTSVLAREGDTVTLDVTRSPFDHGTVTMDWDIVGLNNKEPAAGFQTYQGFIEFKPGEGKKTIILDVLTDNIPEINEEYELRLSNIKTTGVGVSGSAVFASQLRTASITIEGSNNPHGVIQFGSNSLNVRVNEDAGSVQVQVDRKFGAIGAIRIDYQITNGSISLTNPELVYAGPTTDFVAETSHINISDGVTGGSITVRIVEDNDPEVDEVFIVRLVSVTLLDQTNPEDPPVLGATGTLSQIIINANDGTKGVAVFSPDSAIVSVDEVSRNISLTVQRDQGTFGDVSVFFYAQSTVDGTNLGLDYKISPQELVFLKGETTKSINIEIINDDLPEPNEVFEVILSNPKNGLVLGNPSRAIVTILANDDWRGFIFFENDDLVTLNEPANENTESTSADLVISRGPGMYGVVNVPFEIIPELGTNRNDLAPMQGTITFQDLQTKATLTIAVLDDEIPEDLERFTIRLLKPDNITKLGTKIERTILINPNDSPNGLFSLYAAGTRQREISVEEGVGLIHFDLVRTQGLEGQVTVDIATEPGTAMTTADVTEVTLVPMQVLSTTNVGGWYSFEMNNTVYMLMMKPSVVGELTTSLGSSGSAAALDMDSLMYTTLFRWQGELMPIQTIETDGVSSATAFEIDNSQYLVITNMGNHNRYETKSRLYRVNMDGTVRLLQNMDTKGATDVAYFMQNDLHYLVVSNSYDNTGTSQVDSDVYRWDKGNQQFAKVSSLRTLGASAVAVFEIEDKIFLAVANNYDSVAKSYQIDSKIYKFDSNDQFSQHQSIPTMGAMDVEYIRIRSLDLVVFANNRDNTVTSPQKSDVYRWDTATQLFVLHERLDTYRVENVELFMAYDDTVYAVFASGIASSEIFAWDIQGNKFLSVWKGSPALHLAPVIVSQDSGELNMIAIAPKNITVSPELRQLIKVKDSDYAPRIVTMTMDSDEDLLHSSVYVLQDTLPEDTETFYVTLRNPTGGAEIGMENRISVNILSNDNAHGIIEVAPDSLDQQVQELDNRDSPFQFNLIRQQGFIGHVTVKWVATGDHDGTNDITPLEGIAEFANGQAVSTISLTVRDDDIAELQEVTYIQLTEVIDSGTSLPGRGAQIGETNTGKIVVLANDSPYGVVKWEETTFTAVEPEGTDSTILVYVVREQGLMGELQVAYTTSVDKFTPTQNQAISGEDYISRQGMVLIPENVTRVPVEIVIKQDSLPEADEKFIVNITRVTLLGVAPLPGSEPSIRIPGNILQVTISENDNARGVVQFNVTTNIEGRIDVYEEFGINVTIPLQVTRSVGFFGAVTVTWQAEPREATILDFTPSSGTLNLADTQDHARFYVTVIDDVIPENMETFDIKLISVTGGALLGPVSSVRIAILKNDSPNGLFRFVTSEAVVRESRTEDDPDGEVRLMVERIQGSEGMVNVQWRLNAEAVYDFYEPHTGTLLFAQGEKSKALILRTRPDTILEGEERYKASLITADNNADISHTQGDAQIIVLPDPGASGTISIMPAYRTVYIGEPGESEPNYNGKVQVVVSRGEGIYGDIAVTWSITPRDESAFLQVEGVLTIVDLQQKAAITLQALDDTIPELRSVYTLQLNSATGGALLSEVSRAITSDIVFVASDNPHGEFVFDLPQTYITTEDRFSVTFPVIRRGGLNGQVFVTYKTEEGTATTADFYPVESTLTFQHSQNQLFIDVQLKQDDIPEGLESFYLNLTSARLVETGSNNFTEINGLQLDMRPKIGSLRTKEIRIERNDNAEGTIEFTADSVLFTVTEDVGIAQVPLIRKGGNFGEVTIFYITTGETAEEGVDYLLPSGEVIFPDGARNATIDVVITNDPNMEYKETFRIDLTSASDGALLGTNTRSTVTIAKSDFPNGRFEFKGNLNIVLPNPPEKRQQMFTVARTAGLLGDQTVLWQILGPNNPLTPLQETNDIAFVDGNREVTSGTLMWEDGEGGERTFTLDIKPFFNWEIEKVFIIELESVIGSPSNIGDGEVSPTSGKVTLTISKFGHPNGIIRFEGPAQLDREVEEPDGSGTLMLQFPIIRRQDTGTVGNIKVFWELRGPIEEVSDIQPRNGSVLVAQEERTANIVLEVLSDNIPELTETFRIVLMRVEGGAEIDTQFNVSTFRIKYNDQPHGVFGIIPEYQDVIVDPVDLNRHVRLNFTRYSGTFGSVILTFVLTYDIPQSGIVLSLNDGTVKFEEKETNRIVDVKIDGTGFLELDSTFSVSLIEVQYLGSGVTEPPRFQAGQTESKIWVPAIAANSKVGFKNVMASVNEETSTSRLTLIREGMYGTLEVSWQSGFPQGRVLAGFVQGTTTPMSSSVTIPHGIAEKNFTIELMPKLDTQELFAVHLPVRPSTTVPGGARLIQESSLVRIEPYGVLRFADNSTRPVVSEMFGKVYLQVLRVYGSEGKLETAYRSETATASEFDFSTVENHVVVMEPGQTAGLIMIDIVQDNRPEQLETFHINLTRVEKFPTETSRSISPRISYLHKDSIVTIRESNDPYGVLSLEPESVSVAERFQTVNLTVSRTGGIFGTVSVLVRTVGGGEDWTSQIVPKPGATGNDTITEILGNRDRFTSAVGGTDYVVLDTSVVFMIGETEKSVEVTVLSDDMAEPDETVLVYLTQPTGGARIAAGQPDGGQKGFSVITIEQNDLSNGFIGFSQDSLVVEVDEDLQPTFTLKLARIEAFFGEVEVSWIAKLSEDSAETDDVVLASQLTRTAGTALCPGRQAFCFFNISLVNDEIPEEEHKFVIKLVSVKNDAKLNTEALVAEVTVKASDYIRGLIEFTGDSRVVIASNLDSSVRLKVNRLKGQDYQVEVGFRTMQMTSQLEEYRVILYPALEGEDYGGQTGTAVFQPQRQDLQYIDINLTPFTASNNPYPKQFYVDLRNPSSGASLNPEASRAAVIIVDNKDVRIWEIIKDIQDAPLTDNNIKDTISELDTAIQVTDLITDTEITLVEEVLGDIINEGNTRKLPAQIISQLMNLMCKLLTPDKADATRGRFRLAELMERLAYAMVKDAPCQSPNPPDMSSLQCVHAKMSSARWRLGSIQGYQYPGQRQDEFMIPNNIPDAPTNQESECIDIHLIEYSSEQWFMDSAEKQLLSNKVISFGLKGRPSSYTDYPVKFKIHSPDRRIATRQAQCVYFDLALKKWVSPTEVCEVTNDLDLGVDDFVDCSCKHLTHYAVKAKTTDAGLVGYNEWFAASCFICMTGLLLAILAHHICHISTMFSASLLMHMFFAAMATQICYVVNAYLSSDEILVNTLDEDNYRCIVMGIFNHYFFLAQFSWMMTLALNFWKILILNDEHTDRKYVLFFLLGWGLPVVVVAIFYVVTFNLYKYVYDMPDNFIYGDVNNNREICFVTNPYAGLGGVIMPVLLMLLVVAVVFIKAFQVTPQWQAYDDVYRGRYNISEVRTLLLFWAVVIITWMWGGLHLVYGHLWMLVMFCIFNILQGLIALIVYGIVRNPFFANCCTPVKASSYAMNANPLDPMRSYLPQLHSTPGTGQYQFHPTTLDVASLKGSRASLLNESWERDSLPSRSTMKVRRTLPQSGNLYVEPPVYHQNTISDSKDFDDLLYALKTGGSFTPSEIDSSNSDKMSSDTSSKIDKYELRRIDIADTHL